MRSREKAAGSATENGSAAPAHTSPHWLLSLQAAAGNHAVAAVFAPGVTVQRDPPPGSTTAPPSPGATPGLPAFHRFLQERRRELRAREAAGSVSPELARLEERALQRMDEDLAHQRIRVGRELPLLVFDRIMDELMRQPAPPAPSDGRGFDQPAVDRKLAEAMALVQREVWAVRDPVLVPAGPAVVLLESPSDEERTLRRRIGQEFLNDLMSRAGRPDFTRTTAVTDLHTWLRAHPADAAALVLTQNSPEREAMAVEEPEWQVYSETLVGFVPVLGNAVALYEAVGGENMFGRRIPVWQRVVLGVAALLPVAAGLFRTGGAAITAARLARTYRLSEPEALLLFRSLARLRPGAPGAAQLEQAASDVRAGRPLDAARRTQLRRLFDDMGLGGARGAGGAPRSRFAAAEATVVTSVMRRITRTTTMVDVPAVLRSMRAGSRPIERNTAALIDSRRVQLFLIEERRLRASDLLMRNSGRDPAEYEAVGLIVGGTAPVERNTAGFVVGSDQVYVRGMITPEDFRRVVVHEVNHALRPELRMRTVTRTSQINPEARYRMEFDAYWLDGTFDSVPEATRHERIREHILDGYPDIARGLPPGSPGRAAVEAYRRPLGNVLNSAAWADIAELTHTGRLREAAARISELPAAGRAELRSSPEFTAWVRENLGTYTREALDRLAR